MHRGIDGIPASMEQKGPTGNSAGQWVTMEQPMPYRA
jgi:hypothetical protein